ncbi:MAG TPA: 7-carboxy-7-deazaguanine synthase QueE [Planctomycetota bacterium]|nr:7-carboxy-7-deazaguanine synthase QueE [Planctomycetota bacterium]
MTVRKSSASLIEIYSAIQGEGPGVGERQILVRLAGCNRNCRYCDTEATPPRGCRAERRPGERDWQVLLNPVGSEAALDAVERLAAGLRHESVAWTGGEPLLSPRFLRAVIPSLRMKGLRQDLHTNSSLPNELAPLLDLFDRISADVKLPSATGEHLDWEATGRFLKLARGRLSAIKMVVASSMPREEFERALELAAASAPGATLVLQPVTPVASQSQPPEPGEMLAWQARALRTFQRVLVIPQTHKLMGQL